MKLSPLLFGVSLALNAALVAVVLLGRLSAPAPAPAAANTIVAPAPTAPLRDPNDTWATLHSENLDEQIAHLRAAGFPPSVVHALTLARINARFAPRLQALAEAAVSPNFPLWKNPAADPKYLAAKDALSQEIKAALRAALGPDADGGAAAAKLAIQHPYLSPEKIARLVALDQRYNELAQSQENGALGRAMKDEFFSLFTPAERYEYELRTNGPAGDVRRRLEAFDATETEFHALVEIERAFQSAPVSDNTESAYAESTKALFTPERYAEYQRAMDSNYRDIARLVARLGLPPATANDVYALRADLQVRALAAIGSERPVEQINRDLARLAAEAESRYTALLGPSGYQAHKARDIFMQNLLPRPARIPSP